MWVAAAWVLFAATHVGLASAAVRGGIVRRFGLSLYTSFFSVVAMVTFAVLCASYAAVRHAGPMGANLGSVPILREVLIGGIVAGFALMVGAFAPRGYWDSPAMIFSTSVRPAVGLERVTRHPFFAGVVCVFGAHVLLAPRLTGAVFALGFVALAVLGPLHQAGKLRVTKGAAAYDAYLAETSAIPFAAVLAGRQRVVWGELPWALFGVGIAAAWFVRSVHGDLFAWHGAPVSLAAAIGSVLIGLIGGVRARRLSRPA